MKNKKNSVKSKKTKNQTPKSIEKSVEVESIKVEENKKKNEKYNLLPLLIFSFVTSIVALYLAYQTNINNTTYFFSGFNDHISVDSGLLALNLNSNSFEGNNIQYVNKKDVLVTKYKLGYYLKEGNKLIPIITQSGEDERGTSLKNIINNIFSLNFIEQTNIGEYLPKDAIKLIQDDKLYFIVEYSILPKGNINENMLEIHLNLKNTKK